MSQNPAKKPESLYSTLLPNEAITLDAAAFDSFCNNNGVRLLHYRAMPCPVGLVSPDDIRHVHDDHSGCSNGFLYRFQGRVTAFFLTNQTSIRKLDAGFVDGSTAAVTFPRFYDTDATKRIMVRPFDRFYLEEDGIATAATQLMRRRADQLPDRLEYPAVLVEGSVIDSNAVEYRPGVDFDLVNGDIAWRAGKGPAAKVVYSVWYQYKPYWYCDRLVHEIRVIPTTDYIDTTKVTMERLSFGAILNREFVHRDQRQDAQAPNQQRRQTAPPETGDEFTE